MEPTRTFSAGYVGSGVGPHAETARITLTNNMNIAWRVVHVLLFYERATAPTTAGLVQVRCTYKMSGGSEHNVVMLRYTGAGVDQKGSSMLQTPFYMFKGDELKVYTSDASTGGTVHYWATVIYEYV